MTGEDIKYERSLCSFKDCSQRFRFQKRRKFDLQYAQLYAVRLMAMKKKLIDSAKNKWGAAIPITKLSDLTKGTTCIIVGTLFRKMELQPSILKEISLEEGVLPLPPPDKCGSDEDEFILEDEQQRISLTGELHRAEAVTGTVTALLGETGEDGKFHVSEHCYCELPYQQSPNVDQVLQAGEDRFVALVSDLGIGGDDTDLLSLQMLPDLITGRLGLDEDQLRFSNVCRFIIAGNSLSSATQNKDVDKVAKYLSRNIQAKSVEAMKKLDSFISEIGSCMPVDIMPGEFDPTSQFWPQQPLHKCMFSESGTFPTVYSTTNPYEALIGGLRFLGTSGQNINNIFQFSGFEDRLRILEFTLKCGHIAPTCPDTLSCFPYYDADPFILSECPHVYFCGGQPEFQHKMMTGNNGQSVLLVLVPSFAETKKIVMVNLRDLSCHCVQVNTSLVSDEELMDTSGDAEH